MAPAESTEIHTRILRMTLGEPECLAYWQHVDLAVPADERAAVAFEQRWFGARTMARCRTIIATLAQRFDDTPEAIAALRAWQGMPVDARVLVCHWHLQRTDSIYRAFTGRFLVERRVAGKATVDRDQVERWVQATWGDRWAAATRIKFAGNLLTAAGEAGLVAGRTNPRKLVTPRVSDDALVYLLYLLRGATFEGTLFENPYLASVGLDATVLPARLASLHGLTVRRLGDVVDVEWSWPDLRAWAEHAGEAPPS